MTKYDEGTTTDSSHHLPPYVFRIPTQRDGIKKSRLWDRNQNRKIILHTNIFLQNPTDAGIHRGSSWRSSAASVWVSASNSVVLPVNSSR